MKETIDKIMIHPLDKVVRLMLEEMDEHRITRIRHKLMPHWADDMYGKWSHQDPLFDIVFVPGGSHMIKYRDEVDDWREDYFDHNKCILCDKLLVNDEGFTDERYSHLFAYCPIASNFMIITDTEDEFRQKVENSVKLIKEIPKK